jgi:RNA polymerase sigma-70 factor (ECF subfamily)
MPSVQGPQIADRLENLWRACYPRLVVYIRSSFPALKGEAGDLAQETFVHAHGAMDRLSTEVSSGPWLYIIARNLCIDRLRRLRKESAVGGGPEEVDSIEEPDSGVFERIERDRVRNAVANAVKALDPQDREICYLYYFEEFSVAEIGKVLRRPSGTIKYRLFRIRALLKKRLEAMHER